MVELAEAVVSACDNIEEPKKKPKARLLKTKASIEKKKTTRKTTKKQKQAEVATLNVKETPLKKKKTKKTSNNDQQKLNGSEEEPPKKKKKLKNVEKEKENDGSEAKVNGLIIDENSPEAQGDFNKFRISPITKEKLKKKGITYLFPIQVRCFDHIYDGKDVIAQARTGTGKTLSFALPLVEKLLNSNLDQEPGRSPQVLVMAPTRELAIQVHNDFKAIQQYLTSTCIYGGTSYMYQEDAMRRGLDVVVGTTGRILDHVNKGNLRLTAVNHVVLDEVDQMLDMGFAPDVEEILSHIYVKDRDNPPQTLLFSATCPAWIEKTAKKFLKPERTVRVDTIGASTVRTATTVEHLAIRCHYSQLSKCIGDVVQMYSGQHGRALIFTDTKKDANELTMCEPLKAHKAQVMHGDIEQKQREITLRAFRNGNVRCLVATNVAARGLDIPEVDLVIQTSPPQDIDSYIHRSGRTGRAGRTGVCVCFYKPHEGHYITRVERTAGISFKQVGPPQPKDIFQASLNDALTSIEEAHKKIAANIKVSEVLHENAKSIAEKFQGGAIEALVGALAAISGNTALHSRSLLNSQPNRTTWHFQSSSSINYGAFVYTTIERLTSFRVREAMQDLRLTADGMGAVFDLPEESTEEVEALWEDSRDVSLKQADTLPELKERPGGDWGRSRGFGRGFGRRGGRGFRGRSRGGGGRTYQNRGTKRSWQSR